MRVGSGPRRFGVHIATLWWTERVAATVPYDAVIFDNDGILTEPTAGDAARRAARDAFEEFSVEPTEEDVADVVDGDVASVRRVCDRHGVDAESFWPRHEALSAAAKRAALEDGTKPLYDDVVAIVDLDATLAVVSNNQHATVEHILDVFDLDGLFAAVYGREPSMDGIRRKKPAPHYLNRALADLGYRSNGVGGEGEGKGTTGAGDGNGRLDGVLFVGDSNADVLAAERAGVDSAFVRRPHRDGYDLVADPTHELDSLYDLRALCRSR